MLTRTSTYDKLNDADKEQCSRETVGNDVQPSSVSLVNENYNERVVSSSVDSKAAVDSDVLSQVVIRQARHLVEQADQIQLRYVSPPHSIRFSSCMQPQDVIIQRPYEREINTQPETTDSERQSTLVAPPAADDCAASPTQFDTCTSAAASPADKLKRSPIRKFGFIGLWRRQRPDQPVTGTDCQKRKEPSVKSTDTASPRRKTFSWWRRAASPVGTASAERAASNSVTQSSAITCRAAVIAPFSYRPSQSPPSVFADLPQSHQTKTAMLIERRMRRLKMASESSSEQTSSECCKSKANLASRRKNLQVTTV